MSNESTITHYDPEKAVKAQEAFCKAEKIPLFAPIDGVCERCKRNIYLPVHNLGYTLDEAGRKHITDCPHCHKSFCD
ncbi:MAG: hypothetical protein LUI01_00270 [Firmicutes bacterium]|nr:hypothetical protein [Bacillota bacterium]